MKVKSKDLQGNTYNGSIGFDFLKLGRNETCQVYLMTEEENPIHIHSINFKKGGNSEKTIKDFIKLWKRNL